jgi:hypothetical protein
VPTTSLDAACRLLAEAALRTISAVRGEVSQRAEEDASAANSEAGAVPNWDPLIERKHLNATAAMRVFHAAAANYHASIVDSHLARGELDAATSARGLELWHRDASDSTP